MIKVCLAFKCSGSRNNLKNFLSDGSLTSTIVLQVQFLGKSPSVITCTLHRLHSGGKLRGNRFLQTTEDLSIEVEGKDRVDNLEGVLFKDHIIGEFLGLGNLKFSALNTEGSRVRGELENFVPLVGDVGSGERNQSTDTGLGSDEGNKLGVKKLDSIGFSGKEGIHELLRDSKSLLGIRVLSSFESLSDGVFTTFKISDSLLSDQNKVNIDSLRFQLGESLLGLLDHERIVSSAQSTVTSNASKGNLLNLTGGEQRKVNGFSIQSLDKSSKDRLKSLREGTSGENSILSTSDLGGSDKLHGRSDLLCVLNGLDAVTDG